MCVDIGTAVGTTNTSRIEVNAAHPGTTLLIGSGDIGGPSRKIDVFEDVRVWGNARAGEVHVVRLRFEQGVDGTITQGVDDEVPRILKLSGDARLHIVGGGPLNGPSRDVVLWDDVRVTNDLVVANDVTVTNDATVGNDLTVTNDTTVGVDLTVQGNTAVTGTTTSTGNLIKAGVNGAALNIKVNSVNKTTNSGTGTETLTGAIPAGAQVLCVVARVTTILAGAGLTTWSLGDGVDTDLYGTGLALAAGTTVDHTDYTASPTTQVFPAGAAGDLVMTADSGQFDSGVVNVQVFYIDVTSPTS